MSDILKDRIELFCSGNEQRAYEWLGAVRSGEFLTFRVWAPSADAVYLVGSFNSWQETDPMERVGNGEIWEVSLPLSVASFGSTYKYKIYKNGEPIYRSDPYGCKTDGSRYQNTVIYDTSGFVWNDRGWIEQRRENFEIGFSCQPVNIYELHLGSWKRGSSGELLNYREIAEELAPYVKQMGYTHVEIMPISEYLDEESHGYDAYNYYAPTSRYGVPKDFMSFVNTMHSAGIGVILDWMPLRVPCGEPGLCNFDGARLYECADGDERGFDFGRGGVASFLASNAVYWIEKYHVDGLRAIALSKMLCRNCIKDGGDALDPLDNGLGTEAAEFFKKMNSAVKELFPGALLIADGVSDVDNIAACDTCRLGFDFEWNKKWQSNVLDYAATEISERPTAHNMLIDSLSRAANKRYILPIAHDELACGKGSFVGKMPGDYWRKFAGARAFEMLKITAPGKKLTFMGCEIAQFREWTSKEELEWFLLDYESHARHQLFCADLNHFYLSCPELWTSDGFEWIDCFDCDRSIISFKRFTESGSEIVVAINFTENTYQNYFLPVTEDGTYEELFNSDDMRYGGSGVTNRGVSLQSRPNPFLTPGKPAESISPRVIMLRLPPLGATVLKLTKKRFGE